MLYNVADDPRKLIFVAYIIIIVVRVRVKRTAARRCCVPWVFFMQGQ